jgi:hypothetical protein
MKTQEVYLRLMDMFKLSLEVGRNTQDAYNLLIKSGAKVPTHIRNHVDSLTSRNENSIKRINSFIDGLAKIDSAP